MSWEVKPLGDVIQRTETVDPTKDPHEQFMYVDVSGVSNQSFTVSEPVVLYGKDAPSRARKLIRTGDVLFATVRPTLKRIAIVPEELDEQVASTGYFVLRPKVELNNRYLFYYLLSDQFQERMEKIQKGASYPAVTDAEVKAEEIPLAPLPEQQRIVGKLDAAFAALAEAQAHVERNRANARELFESYLNGVFEGKGDGWVEKTLGAISERVSVGHVGPTTKYYCEPSVGIPFLRSQNVRRGKLDWEGVQYITIDFHRKLKKSQLHRGDLLFVRVGANRGDCCAIREEIGELNCANIVFARPTEGNAAYLERYCQSELGRTRLLGMTTGSAQGVINTSSVAELVVPFPPKIVQDRLVRELDIMAERTRDLETTYQKKLSELEELKKSILGAAFRGEL